MSSTYRMSPQGKQRYRYIRQHGGEDRSTDGQLQHEWEKYLKRGRARMWGARHTEPQWGLEKVSLERASVPSQCNVMERHLEQWLVKVSITANQVIVYRERGKGGGFNCSRIEVWNCCHSRIKKNERDVAAMKPGCIAWNWSFLHLHRDIPSAGGELIITPLAVLSCMPTWTRKNLEPIWKKLEPVY